MVDFGVIRVATNSEQRERSRSNCKRLCCCWS